MNAKKILTGVMSLVVVLSAFGAEIQGGKNQYGESGKATANDFAFRGTYTNIGPETADTPIAVYSNNYSYSVGIGSDENRISAISSGWDIMSSYIGFSTVATSNIIKSIYFDKISGYTDNNSGRWAKGLQLRNFYQCDIVSINDLQVTTNATTTNAVSMGIRFTGTSCQISVLEIKNATITGGVSCGVRGIESDAGGVVSIGVLRGNLNITSNFIGTTYLATNSHQRACGITEMGTTRMLNIDSIEANINVVAEKSGAWGIYGIAEKSSYDLNLAKNASISAKGVDAANSWAVYINASALNISGDSNTQTLRGNIYSKYVITVNSGNFKFGSNFAEGSTWSTEFDTISFKSGSNSMFTSSTAFLDSSVVFESGAKAVLFAESITSFTSLDFSDSDVSVNFESGSALELVLGKSFSAEASDTMSIVVGGKGDVFNGDFYILDSLGNKIDESLYSYSNGVVTFLGAVPEPSAYAALFGIFALGFIFVGRRR